MPLSRDEIAKLLGESIPESVTSLKKMQQRLKEHDLERVKLLEQRNLAIYHCIVEDGVTQVMLASALGISKQRIREIVKEMTITSQPMTELERYTAELAKELGPNFGVFEP